MEFLEPRTVNCDLEFQEHVDSEDALKLFKTPINFKDAKK